MKLKRFIFALVAMLSFAFPSLAQTVVTDAAGLKSAMSSSGDVSLGSNITLNETISIPQGVAVTLDLNGKKITGGSVLFEVTGSLTIEDSGSTGTLTSNSRVVFVKTKGKLTLNGGTLSKTAGTVIYTGGTVVINGGSVKTAPSNTLNVNTAAITGAGGTVTLNGGTVTSIVAQFCDLKIKDSKATVTNGLNIYKGAKGAEITAGTINGNVTVADEIKNKVSVSGGTFEDTEAIKDLVADGSTFIENPDGTIEVVAGLLKIKETGKYYPTLATALEAATNGQTVELLSQEGSVIAMNGAVYGKSVTITGTATVDWSKGFLFVARGGAGNATLTFDNANLTSASNNASTGIHVSGREKGTNNKYDGTLVIKNSTIELDYLINKGAMTLDNSSLTVKNGFDLNGRPASETENGEDANATLALANNSKLVVNNHNGMGIGREGKGELTVDASSTFEHTQDFLVCAKGTMDVKGTLVSNGKKLTNNGEVKFTATKLTDATIEGMGTTRFYNDVNFYGANSITTGINGTPFHLVVNEGANLFITRFTLGYDRNITVNGTITDASAFNPEGQTPSLKFNSTSGVSVGGTGTGNLTVNNAYVELGSSSWKNAQGTYDWDFVNSYVSATSFTNATGADAATWDVTFDKSVLAAKNYIKNGKNVTYNFTNNSRGTTGSLRIDGVLNIDATSSVETTSQQNNKVGAVDEHGGINGTVNVAGSLTIGSNAKTQLEVLGGTVNVAEGATLDLGNHTLTLDATSAMQSAGNISGAITAADGADVAISGGTYTQNVDEWCAEGFMTQQNADGSFGIAKAVAKVGDKKYATLDEAVQAAKVGDKITLLDNADLAFAHNPQYNFVYASEIDLNGKTMTIKKGDIRFDNVTIKNGNIIVQPGTYNGTAIFLMYSKNLTFDDVNVTATGVASTYLIGLEGTSNLNLLNGSEIAINNESLVNIGSIIADNGKGNTVTIKDSKIDIKNSDARLYLGGTNGKITVENSDIDLNGVKEGFYLRAGQTLAITGTSTVDITLNTNEGRYGINLTDLTATYTKAETATVNATLKEVTPAAVIGTQKFASLQAAINAVKDGETITLTDNVTGNVTLTEKVGLRYTIDGAGKTMNGKITITPLSDESDNRRITIKGINFVNTADAAVDFISCVVTNHYPRLTVEGCTFTGNGKNTDVALRLKTAYGAVIKDCTGTGLHSFLQNTAGKNLIIENVNVTTSKGAFALGTVQGVTIKGSTIGVATYGIRMDANTYNNNAVIEGNKVTAFIPVVVRNVNTQSNVTFTGENTFTAENTDGKWMVIGTTEYEENGKLPAETAEGNVVVALNNTNLSYEGVHGAGLAGKGTAEAPYLINNIAELEIFRNSVNAGSTKYSKPGLCIALGADIDMTGVNWVGIGTATADHGFMGNFDGKNFKIKNLTIDNPALDSDGYAYAGLFGVTEGTDKDNQNTIKNLTIENVTINTTGDIVSAAIAYPYYTNVDNVKVCGDIKIQGGKYTAGVLAYTRRCVNASNLSIVGNDGSYVKGTQTVGGVISDIQMNGGLTAVYSNFSAEGITVTGEKSVGGIAGIIATQTLNGATVKNVTLNSTDEFAGVVAGRLGGTSTISNVVSENVTGATAVIGATFDGAKAVEARIGDTYYATLDAALAAEGDEVELFVPVTVAKDETRVLDLKGKTVSHSKACTASYEMIKNLGNLTIKNGTLSFTDTSAGDPSFGWGSYTINNYGTLVVEEGATIQHLGAQEFATHMIAAIQQAKGSTTINGGVISTPNYRSVRINGGALAINGGEFDGQVWLQPNQGDVTIAVNGGTFGPNGRDGSSIFMTNVGENKTVTSASITGGTFTTKIGCSDAAALAGIITGGKFTEAAMTATNGALIGDGFTFDKNAENGYYAVVAGLDGDGTEAAPYMITSVKELELFRESVNNGETKYNAPGVWVALGADIDLANAEWTVGIGDGHNFSFDGNFDGKNHTIKNLNIKPYADADSYICGGLFGYTYGAVTIKNLVIENATVNFATPETGKTYHNVGVLVGFANNKDGKLNVDNVIVKGDIKVDAPQTFGVGAIVGYSYREMGAITNTNVLANAGSYIKGERFVGGITGYSYNNAIIDNCTVENLALTGEIGVGGIAGLALNGNKIARCTVKSVTVNGDKNVAYIVGELGSGNGGNVTVADNCNAPQPWVGGSYATGESFVATIGTQYYTSIAKAVEAAQAGETITLLADIEATEVILLGKSLTINGNGHKVTSNATRVFRVTVANTEVTLNDVNMVNTAVRVGTNDIRGISVDDVQNVKLTLNNCSVDFTDASANDWTYAVNVVGGSGHVVTVNGGAYEGANVINVRGTNNTVTVKDATLTSLYLNNGQYYGACIYVVQNANSSVEATGNTFNGDNAIAFNVGYTPVTESDNTDNTKYVVAMIGDAYYTSIQAAVEAAQNGETIKLTQNVKMDTKTLATQNDGYAVLVNAKDKKVTIDLNGKKITVNAAAADLASAKGKMLLTVFHADTNGELTLTDNTADMAGAVVVNVNDATVYSVFASESQYSDKSESGKLTVNAGNYTTVGKIANAMFFTDANEVITVNGGNFHCDGATTTASNPWMFNTLGNNELHVTVNGGTFNVDVNHQHRPFEVKVPETLAVKANGNGTWTVVSAEAYITEMLGATVNEAGEWGRKVGYATLAEAMAAVKDGQTITLVKDITYTKENGSISGDYVDGLVYTGDKSFTLDFAGKTITENGDINDYLVYLKNAGEKDNEITFKNGTIAINGESSNTAWAAITVGANSATHKTTLNLNGMTVVNGNPNNAANQVIRVRKGSVVNLNEGTVVTSNGTSYGVVAETTATVNINKGAKVVHTNSKTSGGNQVYTAVSGNGTINVYEGAEIVSDNYGIHNMTSGNAVINIYGGTIEAKVAVKASTNGGADQSATVTIEGGNFKGALENYTDAATIVVKGGTFDAAVDTKYVATGYICKDNGDGTFGVIVDPKHGMVAQIIRDDYYAENQYFATINEAVQAAVSGETVTLIADVETSAAKLATVGKENYAVLVAVKEKDITLNLNGKSVTVTPTAEELANAEGKMLMSVFGMDTNGKLTLTGNGSVKVNANGANVYSLVAAYGEGSAVVIENGNYEADKVMSSGSLIYSHELITVMDGTFNLGNIATGANGSPWIFNTIGQNYTGVKVVGGTYPTDINHQFWANEVLVPEEYALKNNGNDTWTVVPAVAYTNEKATSRGASWRHVGYASLEDAIAATGKYNCQDNTVTMIKDITLEPITVANGVEVAIDLNGKTISGTDNGTASFGLITNKGDLTINGTGAITLIATQNRGWSAYSSVISNQPGGKLTVNGGTIEHLGGTSMAYAIDNLTNGKGTYAETEINGGIVKSAYIAIRQFLNGVEAENILNVYGGTLEGKYSIYFQDPSKSANTGSLYVDAEAALNASVYLGVTAESTEWPVEVSVATAALKGESTVISKNVPATYFVTEYPTAWIVECSELAELTIDEADYAETGYINLVEKNVETLTYVREFDGTWETLYLPFNVKASDLAKAGLKAAYIYNASNKNNEIVIDYVEIEDEDFELMANYPYLICAAEAGVKEIVVENATLKKTTEQQTIDCSTVFEMFTFIGNYAANYAPETSVYKKYFVMEGGDWTSLYALNPFRFYFQMEKRNGGEFPADVQNIRMRSVNENGEITGIDGVDAEKVDYIFDLHGRRILEPQKGQMYIINGKKVIF